MEIIRTQIYLRKDQHHLLRDEAHRLGLPLTELLRRALDSYLGASERRSHPKKGLAGLIGIANSGPVDGSTRHDDYFAEAIEADLLRDKKKRSTR